MSLKWLPNALSWVRIVTAPIIALLIYASLHAAIPPTRADIAYIALALFIAAAVTDWLDGFAARKLDAASDYGAKLDLWGDKILVAATLVAILPTLPFLALFGLLTLTARDIYIMRLRAQRPDVNLKASFLAKSKTAIIMAALALTLFGYAGMQTAMANGHEDGIAQMMVIIRLGLSLYVFGCVLSVGTAFQYINAAAAKPAPPKI